MRVRSKVRIIPEAWKKLRPHPKQAAALQSKSRFVNLACGRRSGKTEIARRKVVIALQEKKPWKDPVYFYALPTYAQAKKVAWRELLKLIPAHWIKTCNVMDLYIKTIFGSELYVVGMDQPQRIEGLGYDGGVIDEMCDHKPGSFDLSVRPALEDRQGWCWRIGVPKRTGIGSQEAKIVFDRGLDPNFPGIESYAWPSSDILTEEAIKQAKREMDPKDYREQFEASWEQSGGLIFYTFNEKEHAGPKAEQLCQYRPHLPLYIGMDFNVDPMAWVICQIVEDHPEFEGRKGLLVLDELFIRNTNTPECLRELYRRWQHHKGKVYFCGDAASRQRKSSASRSDYLHITNFDSWPEKYIGIPSSNPHIADRFSVTNSVIKNADDQISMYVHPKCVRLVMDLNYRAYKEGTNLPNDQPDQGHITDAIGYLMWSEFPMAVNRKKKASVLIRSF